MRIRIVLVLIAGLALGACSKPIDRASPDIRQQYLQIARIATERTSLDITDAEWLEFANLVCTRRVLNDADYDELITEIESGAPTPELGRAARDVGQTAISLFCPLEE